MWRDPIVEEVRRLREEYAARFNHNLTAICRDLRQRQKGSGRKVVLLAAKRVPRWDRQDSRRLDQHLSRRIQYVSNAGGNPVGVENTDEENWDLEMSPGFWRMIQQRRGRPTVPLRELDSSLLNDK